MTKQTINEIKAHLLTIEDENDPFFLACLEDERKGVQVAVKQWYKRKEAEQMIIQQYQEKNRYERNALKNGHQFVAGIDEVGRGPLAGPVVSAAVILDSERPIYGLDDSKKLSLTKRTALFNEIKEKAIAVGIGIVTADDIDRMNILQATKKSMKLAVSQLSTQPDLLLVDAVELNHHIPQETIIKGDSKSNSIAAASIIAKITRDRLMEEYHKKYPGYGFDTNAGYGTKLHLEGLEKHGITAIHRTSFSPVSNYLK